MFQRIARLNVVEIIAFGGLLFGLYYFLQFQDNIEKSIKKLEAKETQQAKVGKDKNTKQKELDDRLKFKQKMDLKEEAILHFLNFVPNDLTPSNLFAYLDEEAKLAGINIQDKQDRDSLDLQDYTGLRMDVKVKGSFSQVLLFLSKLTSKKRIIVVDEIDIRLKEGGAVSAEIKLLSFKYNKKDKKDKKEEGSKNINQEENQSV